jgi:beta-galactosidase
MGRVMNYRLLLIAILTIAAAGSVRARGGTAITQSSNNSELSLDGQWQFTVDPAALARKDAQWDSISVPGNWDTLPAYRLHKGSGWYRRSFTPPQAWQGKHVRIHFGAVYEKATVWLNGQNLGSHEGGYTPFDFDLTGRIRWDGPNDLLVEADNSYQRGAWWPWGGISRDVTLIASGEGRILWQHVRAEPDLANGTADVFVSWKIANQSDRTLTVSIASTLDGAMEPTLSATLTIAAKTEQVAEARCTMPKDRVRLWDFDHPNLYLLTSRLAIDANVVDERADRFGIRKVQVVPDGLLLNGQRVRLCGFNRVSDSNEAGNTEPDELVHRDIDLMKSSGANLCRLMHYPQAPNLLNYLDEKGMLIFGEIPIWGGGDPSMKPDDPLARQWMREMIDRDFNHPCIIGWSMGNELAGHNAYVRSMLTFTRDQLDDHRILTYVSNSGLQKGYGPKNDPISASDILLHNYYGPSPGHAAEVLHAKWPDLPIFFSEYGIHQFGAGSGATIPGLEKSMATLAGHPYVIGVSLWTFNDYRSGFKDTPSSGNREWGVVDVNRHQKAAYQQVRKLFSPVHSLTIANGIVRIEPRGVDEIPSYSLRGYKLRWSAGEMDLPDVLPGSAACTFTLPSQAGARTAGISLITPTGYDVADASDANTESFVKPHSSPTSDRRIEN